MDLETLLILLLILFPLLSRLFGRRPQPEPPPPPPPYESEPSLGDSAPPSRRRAEEEDPLAEALRQIREALGEPATAPPPPRREPAPPPVRRPPPPPRPATSTPPRRGSIQEPTFLQQARRAPLSATASSSALDEPLRVERRTKETFKAQDLVARLRQPEKAREAMILKEILDRPVGLRRRRSRWPSMPR